MKIFKKPISLLLSVAMLFTVFCVSADEELVEPKKVQTYKATNVTSYAQFSNNCKTNETPINLYKISSTAVDPGFSDGAIVFGGSSRKAAIMEFPNFNNKENELTYPTNYIKGSVRIGGSTYYDGAYISYSSKSHVFSGLKYSTSHNGNDGIAYNGIKLLYSVNSKGFKVGFYPENYYYDKTMSTSFENGNVSVHYTNLHTDSDIVYGSSTANLEAGELFVDQNSVWLNFHMYYKDVYNSKTQKYESKLYFAVKGTYDVYTYQTTGANKVFVETRTFEKEVEISPYNNYYHVDKNLAIGCFSIYNASKEIYFKDIEVGYDLSAYYEPAANTYDKKYSAKLTECEKTVAALEALRAEYKAGILQLDENIQPFVQEAKFDDEIDKAIAGVVNDKYAALYNDSDKSRESLKTILSQFLTEYNNYTDDIKAYINYYEIKEQLEDGISATKTDCTLPVITPEYSAVSYNTVTVNVETGYEYAVVRKDQYDYSENYKDEQEKSTYLRRLYNWQTEAVFEGLKSETDYYVVARVKETEEVKAGTVCEPVNIQTLARPGDVNHDCELDATDVSVLIANIVDNSVTETDFCDFNKDNTVDVADVIFLKRVILGYDGYILN